MKNRPFKDPYIVSAMALLAAAWVCAWVWGWGPLVFGFFLLLYFIVALGVRLDEISSQMKETGRRLDRFLALEERRYHEAKTLHADPCLEDIRSHLASIEAALGRVEQKLGQ